ncbi:Ferredoxin-NADP reductase [Modestobacter sp. DSM 44400]|uniref:ferredoxin reductase family protein n=1 Tax=Modestobacter sp. DSM 44400 TaxID=1550230 RepID=UPI00089C8AA3|nr:ferredoxin reductase family protein [Modestobacter sp. DSM 44400]SDX90943.1 Ferredoxin-NADP reductase [Modestobacter sp. DSM 44400]
MTAVATPWAAAPVTAIVDGARARLDAGVRLAALVALWSSLLLVTYWWATGGGFQDLGSWADGLTSTGRLTGLLASDLLLVQVLLMARVPTLEHAFGQDRLARVHRLVGFTSFNAMLAHIGLITWGYAAGKLGRTPATLSELTVDYPGILLAVAGTACRVLVVVSSVKAARRRLRYESWHLLHLYAYLGVGLALPHQLWTGQDFLASTARTVFWWGLWIACAVSVLVWRVALPLWRSARYRVRVTSVVPEGEGIVSVHMAGRRGMRLSAEAGQFFTFRFLSGRGWTRAHPYSLSAAPDGRNLRITVQVVGDGSASLRLLRPGTRVLVEGPYGRLCARARTRPKLAFIGAGVGITPLRALAEALDYAPGDAVLLYRYSGRPLFQQEIEVIAAERGLQVIALPGHRRAPGSWLGDGVGPASDLTALASWVPDIADRDVYVCGPDPWSDDVRHTTEAAGLPADRFHVESFGG